MNRFNLEAATMRITGWLLILLAMCGCTVLTVQAQTSVTSTIVGTVTDPSGALVAGAQVHLMNVDTGAQWSAASATDGQYVFADLNAGNYRVTVTSAGFKQVQSQVITLGAAGTTQRIDIPLAVGNSTQSVTVTASAIQLAHTDDADVNLALNTETINNLPVQGRNFLNYAQLAPLFNSGNGQNQWGVAQQTTAESQKPLNLGGSEGMVGYYIDGINNNDNWGGSQLANINMNAVRDVQVQSLNYSAEFTRDIGQINLTMKSGTNRLHGDLYDFVQDASLNAIDAYAGREDPGVQRTPYYENQFGGGLGGPIYLPHVFNGRDRAFFFVAFEGIYKNGSSPVFGYVPTAAERTGDFSAWLQKYPNDPRYVIYNPFTLDPVTLQRQPYPNNVITNADPRALNYLSHFPQPNFTSSIPGSILNWQGEGENSLRNNNLMMRFDYNPRTSDQIFFEFMRDWGQPFQAAGPIPALALGDGPLHWTPLFNGQWVHTFTPSFYNRVQIGYLRQHVINEDPGKIANYQSSTNSWFCDLAENTSLPNAGLSSFDRGQLNGIKSDACLYQVTFGGSQYGFNTLSLGPSEYYYQRVPILQIADDVTKIVGRNTFQMGLHYYRKDEQDNDIIRGIDIGTNTLNAHFSSSGLAYTGKGPLVSDGSGWNTEAEFVTGVVTAMRQRTYNTGGDTSLYFRSPEWDAYFNDNLQVTPKLTVTLGLAYVLAPQAYSLNNYWGVLDQSYPGWRLVMPGLTPGVHNPPFPSEKLNFAPRFGFAYRPNKSDVVRGGYGLFYDTSGYKYLDSMFFNAPGYGGSEYDSPTYAALNGENPNVPYFTLANTFPAPVTLVKGTWPVPLGEDGGILTPQGDTTTIDKDTSKTPYFQYWNLQIEHQLGSAAVFSLGYVGSKGTKLPRPYDLNLPPEGVYLNSQDYFNARPLSANYPNRFGAVNAIHDDLNNNYNALEVEFRSRPWHNLSVISNYAWSKQMDIFYGTSAENGINAIGGQWHPEWSYGPSDANHTHHFVASTTYDIPVPAGWNRLSRAVAGGWQLNSITTFESGSPLTIFNGSTSSYDYMGDVPIRTCNGNLARSQRTFFRAFDTSCFTDPPAGSNGVAVRRGNAGRNIITGPGINNWDMSVLKSVGLGEGRSLQFRLEAYNAFNHPQWSSVNGTDDTLTNQQSTFGFITGDRPPRLVELSGRFDF
jgi:hypothetical protein